VCPTQACAQWRATIGDKLAAGWSDQQILDYFVAQYGERVLARPSTHGLNVLVWVIPPLLVLGSRIDTNWEKPVWENRKPRNELAGTKTRFVSNGFGFPS